MNDSFIRPRPVFFIFPLFIAVLKMQIMNNMPLSEAGPALMAPTMSAGSRGRGSREGRLMTLYVYIYARKAAFFFLKTKKKAKPPCGSRGSAQGQRPGTAPRDSAQGHPGTVPRGSAQGSTQEQHPGAVPVGDPSGLLQLLAFWEDLRARAPAQLPPPVFGVQRVITVPHPQPIPAEREAVDREEIRLDGAGN